jgi:ParB family transcriptional regulator, chromosome partitioning protein
MGKGLAAILPDAAVGGPELREVPVGSIEPNPDQPRTVFEPDALAALSDSISSAGLLQPLIVRPLDDGRFQLVAGERRWRASQKAGLDLVPVVVRSSPEDERLQSALIENVVREDLNPVDEARACAALVDDLGISKEDLAKRLGRSRAGISNLVRLLDLPDGVLELLADGSLSEGHGRALLMAPDQTVRLRLGRKAAKEGWSVRETERQAKPSSAKNGKKASTGRISAEERVALTEAGEGLEEAIGHEVKVRRSGSGFAAELRFDDLSEVAKLAKRLRKR